MKLVELMLETAEREGLRTVDQAIGYFLTNLRGSEDPFLAQLYNLGLDTESAGNMSIAEARAKYFNKVVAKS